MLPAGGRTAPGRQAVDRVGGHDTRRGMPRLGVCDAEQPCGDALIEPPCLVVVERQSVTSPCQHELDSTQRLGRVVVPRLWIAGKQQAHRPRRSFRRELLQEAVLARTVDLSLVAGSSLRELLIVKPIADKRFRHDPRFEALEGELAPEVLILRRACRFVVAAQTKNGITPVHRRRMAHVHPHDEGVEDEVDVVGQRLV